MKQTVRKILILVFAALFLVGCGSKDSEEPTVTVHDFTVEQWADFYDQKKAAEAGANSDGSGENGSGNENPGNGSDNNSGSSGDNNGNSNGTGTDGNNTDNGTDNGPDTSGPKTIVITIDPGHGGKRTGAIYNKVNEKDLTLKVSKYIRDYLLDNYENVEVYLTREEDVDLDPDLAKDLEKRAIIAKDHNSDALVSVHFNASEDHKKTGTYIYVSRREHVAQQCKDLAKAIMKEMTGLGLRERAIEQRKSNDMFDETGDPYDYYAINRHCAARNIPGIIVEQCFMDNDNDWQFIESEMALKSLGEANAKGIAAYFELVPKDSE